MHRTSIGLASLVLLAAAAALALWQPGGEGAVMWASAFLRVGLVLGTLWLAYPQVSRSPKWLLVLGVALVMAVMFFRQPRLLALVLVGMGVVLLVRPRLAALLGDPPEGPSRHARRKPTDAASREANAEQAAR